MKDSRKWIRSLKVAWVEDQHLFHQESLRLWKRSEPGRRMEKNQDLRQQMTILKKMLMKAVPWNQESQKKKDWPNLLHRRRHPSLAALLVQISNHRRMHQTSAAHPRKPEWIPLKINQTSAVLQHRTSRRRPRRPTSAAHLPRKARNRYQRSQPRWSKKKPRILNLWRRRNPNRQRIINIHLHLARKLWRRRKRRSPASRNRRRSRERQREKRHRKRKRNKRRTKRGRSRNKSRNRKKSRYKKRSRKRKWNHPLLLNQNQRAKTKNLKNLKVKKKKNCLKLKKKRKQPPARKHRRNRFWRSRKSLLRKRRNLESQIRKYRASQRKSQKWKKELPPGKNSPRIINWINKKLPLPLKVNSSVNQLSALW